MLQFLHHYTAYTIYELCCSSICYKQNPKRNIFTSLYKLRIFIGITLGAIVWSGLLPSLLSSVYNTMLISVWQETISMGRKTVFWISPFPTVKLNIFSIFKQKAKITNKRMDEIEMFTHTCRVLLRKSLELRLLSSASACFIISLDVHHCQTECSTGSGLRKALCSKQWLINELWHSYTASIAVPKSYTPS